MGVPKFFRYISERYPCLSELVREYQIPEFDNLYLDMNGIIHMCSHPDDNNPHFRITEERIFKDIFHYIEVIFRMIRPQKLFFMAVDGVAPRAKMNQQRGRRFRSAKDAEKMESEAKKKGETLPDQARFDSNCITPGTEFMARLHEQLKYFVVDKISNNEMWQKCKVILSGHETPGEGEHKIMDYIRYMRAQPGYDPNTRHCLYGLDADLIMLGLCTHEPHFSLLREEVKFGKKSTKRMSVPEEITYYLLHLSLMREYLELEFAPLKNKLGFKYDFEKIIDDWVLMGFLVGNDFIPHLPNLHIANGALPVLYKAYMDILPNLDGYINEGGTLNLERFEKFMKQLGSIDVDNFDEIRDDLTYMEAKTGRKVTAHPEVSSKPRNLEVWNDETDSNFSEMSLEPEKPRNSDLAALIKECDDMCLDSTDEGEPDQDISEEDEAFESYKREYYQNKLEYSKVTSEVMRDQAEGYVRAIQWNLHYYYNGVCSWSWYYPHHYAPFISDIKSFQDLKLEFELGQPFKPFEQLLAVLPSASKNLLPPSYHSLMTDENSIINKYYPEEFQTDLNGKKQEWEAVVLVPFIDENLLLEAMKPCNEQLTEDEKKRNTHGPMLVYTYTSEDLGPYEPPQYFSTIPHNKAYLCPLFIEDIRVPIDKLVKGAYPNVKMDVYYPGFPTMKHLKYKAELQKAKIRVFETPSRNENMIITIIPNEKISGVSIPADLLGTTIFVGWPHLIEAKVVAISNSKGKYTSVGSPGEYNYEERNNSTAKLFKMEVESVLEYYKNRMGIDCGETKVLVHVQVMIGRRYVFTKHGRINLEKQFATNTSNYPLQAVVYNISAYDSLNSTFKDVEAIFPVDSTCFTLANPYYGSQGKVLEVLKTGRIKICISSMQEPNLPSSEDIEHELNRRYKNLHHASSSMAMGRNLFSRITGSIFVTARNNEGGFKSVNIGLDLKLNKKNKETPGYTKKKDNTWYYSDKAVELVNSYMNKFPEILEYLSQNDKFDDILVDHIFPVDGDERLKELQKWLKEIPTHSIEKQTCGSSVLDPEIIKIVEDIIDNYQQTATSKKVTMEIKPDLLYRPELQNGTLTPDPTMKVKLLDRIVNVRPNFSVPFGLKGTVVGVNESGSGSERDIMYDVVFDKSFEDGMSLNCSAQRGYRLPRTSFVNISHGQRLLQEKTGKTGDMFGQAKPGNSINSPYNNYQNLRQEQSYRPQNSAFASFNNGQSLNFPNAYHQNKQFPTQHNVYNNSSNGYSQFSPKQNQSGFNNSYGNVNYGSRTQPQNMPKSNMFMPEFSNSKKNVNYSNNVHQQMSPKVKTESNVNDSNKQIQKPPVETTEKRSKPEIDVDFLKKMLKIGDNQETSNKENLKNEASSSKSETQTTQNVSFDMFAKAAKSSPSVSLLTYYQSNGLGLPRYQYFNTGKMVQAQMYLPNGESVIGSPANSREEACEKVASEVLKVLVKNVTTSNDLSRNSGPSQGFPVPPKTWVHPNHQHSNQFPNGYNKRHQNNKGKGSQNKHHESNSQTNTSTSNNVISNAFVPLQALKHNINKTSNSSKHNETNLGKQNLSGKETASGTSAEKEQSHKGQEASTSRHANKPKRERKMRIAANFQKQ